MKEIWKDIPNYEGLYQVTNTGRVRSFKIYKDGFILKPKKTIYGYYCYTLIKDKKRREFGEHQLVAITFLNHIIDGHNLIVDHINNNKLDNRVENLQITTVRHNNSKDKKNKTSKHTGVSFNSRLNKYISQITINYNSYHLGVFNNEEEAYKIYDKTLKDFENLNILPKSLKSSKYYGVSWSKQKNKWTSRLSNKGGLFLGYFNTEIEAHNACQNKLKELNEL